MGLFSKNKTRDFFFNANEKNRLADLIQKGTSVGLDKVAFCSYGHRLRVNFTKDRQHVTLQIFEYIPHQYVPYTEAYTYTGTAALAFCRALKL